MGCVHTEEAENRIVHSGRLDVSRLGAAGAAGLDDS